MFRRRRSLLAFPLLVALVAAAGCSRLANNANITGGVPLTASTAISATEAVPPSNIDLKSGNNCTFINSNDLAHLFPPHNEITRDAPKTSAVSHPPFSDASAAGTETSCTFFDFHQPGKLVGWMLQVTYLVDTPDPSAAQSWNQAWAAAKARSGQPVSGLGDDAFASGANLFIKNGSNYISFESIDTHLDMKSAAGAQQVVAYEKQLAEAGLSRVK